MSRADAREFQSKWLAPQVLIQDPPVTSLAALTLLQRKYHSEDKSHMDWLRLMKFRAWRMNQLMKTPDAKGGLTCAKCKKQGLQPWAGNKKKHIVATLDHIIPIVEGGAWNDPNNTQILCYQCANKKSHGEGPKETPKGKSMKLARKKVMAWVPLGKI